MPTNQPMHDPLPAPPAGDPRAQRLSGDLRSELHLVLQTRHAQLLVRGRDDPDKPVIIGMLGFADRLRLIWQAAAEDDPFADWYLLQVHDALSTAEARVATELRDINARLRSTRTMHIAPAGVKEPFRMALRFSTPYAFRAARLLGEFDELACAAFTARQIGELTESSCAGLIRGCARRLRAVFILPQRFRRLGITRAAASESHPAFQRGVDLMGPPPSDVLAGTRRATLAPPIVGAAAHPIPPVASDSAAARVAFE